MGWGCIATHIALRISACSSDAACAKMVPKLVASDSIKIGLLLSTRIGNPRIFATSVGFNAEPMRTSDKNRYRAFLVQHLHMNVGQCICLPQLLAKRLGEVGLPLHGLLHRRKPCL